VAEDAIFPSTIADSIEVWPELLEMAKSDARPRDVRQQALFWVAQAAGDVVAGDLEELATDDDTDHEVRESAVFAISQLDDDRGVPALIRIVRTNTDGRIRRQAVFWLGQSEDPRALALFEELLLGGG
jgi:HEAT repeat protein